MTVDIRIASREDLPLLIQLYAEMDGESPLQSEQAADIFTEITKISNYHIYLAFQNQEPVGTFSLLYAPTMMHRGYHKFAVLDSVTVTPQVRGQGIGTQMVKAALQLSAEAGCYKVMLSSNIRREKAHQFYQSLGFEQHGWSFKCVLNQLTVNS
ncbi:GNAT family N-acetyltransferase [Calothrix sp. PCC 7507]|uniref:GNAT family N-acetyltransferase n=1 Tax=Calothrix sp. PCC 7507 TaxID=99598 RepID=UPI00029F4329|nr:GNAT family N-acetyltransferase [Calothrix sp. PCC 7507]AFY34824.1 GCN5-related N-acetyltransferase [Calothrix sp. PCC 7507]